MNIILLSLAPVFILAIYIYIRDKYEKEPVSILLKTLFAGAIIVIPVIFVERLLAGLYQSDNIYFSASYRAFVIAGFTEELFKFAALYVLIWTHKEFDELFDGIVYAVFISLGFAGVENIFYVSQFGFSTGLIRAITAVPAHMLFGVAMGYYFGLARFTPGKNTIVFIKALLLPVLLHGLYDFILFSVNTYLLLFFIPYVIYLWYSGLKQIRIHTENSRFRDKSAN